MSNTTTTLSKVSGQGLIESPFTPVVPDKRTISFAIGLLKKFGDLVLVDTDNNRIATTAENPEVFGLFKRILLDLSEGKAVSVVPYNAELTTHQAANFLNVSRPFLIKILEENKIPYHMVGTHRRVRFEDLIAYKKSQQVVTRDALAELTRLSQEYGLD